MPASADALTRPTATRRRSMTLLETAWWASVAAALGVLPFNSLLVLGDVNGIPITPLYVAVVVAALAWLGLLVRSRRLPGAPAVLCGGAGLFIGVLFVSAALADGHNDEALRVAFHGGVAVLMFVALVDMVRGWRPAAALSIVIVASFTASAVLGLILLPLPREFTLVFAEWDYSVAGVRRLIGSLGYPTTAAMAFEAVTFVAIGLFASLRTRRARGLLMVAVALLVAATLLTLSRGSILGYAGGFAVLLLAALATHRRRLAIATAAGAVALGLAVFAVQFVTVPTERLLTDSEAGFYNATYDAPEHIEGAFYDHPADVVVTVTNTGNVNWAAGRYRLGYHWINPATREILEFGHDGPDLGDVARGETVTATIRVDRPHPGQTLVAWDIHQVGGEWFSERGVPVESSFIGGSGSYPPPHPDHLEPFLLYPALLAEPDRAELWDAAVQMIRDRPLLGVGPGTYRLRYGAYLGLDRWDLDIHANNTLLEIGATSGLIGLAAFLFVTLYVLWRQARFVVTRRDAPQTAGPAAERWWLVVGFAAAAAAYLVHGMVDYFLGFDGTLGLYWAILGIGLGAALVRRKEPATR